LRIGLHLGAHYRTHQDYEQLIALFDDPLVAVRDTGVDFVEWTMILSPDWQEAEYRDLAKRSMSYGLPMTVHPYLNGPLNLARFEDAAHNASRATLQRFLRLTARFAEEQHAPCSLVLHPGQRALRKTQSRKELHTEIMARNQTAFRWLARTVRANGYPVRVFSETVQRKPDRPQAVHGGGTFEDVLASVAGTELGVCWDTGHTYLASQDFGEPLFPPDAFLKRVGHVHLHDVRNPEQFRNCGLLTPDHQPLVWDNVPLAENLRLLKQAGFDGDINLELKPNAVLLLGDFVTVARESVARLQQLWDAA